MNETTPAKSKLAQFVERRQVAREQMGGQHRIDRLHAAGLNTARERIALLLDADSFDEIGTFATAEDPKDRANTPGDGRIAGFGTIGERPVGIVVDDATVKGASASATNIRKADRVYAAALKHGHPFVFLGETRGSRMPESLGADGLATVSAEGVDWTLRARRIPMATVVTGPSFGGSTFAAAMSDFVVQVKGSTLAVVSPRVIEIATGERTDMDKIGGTELHATITGQIDREAENDEEAMALVRRWLSYLPANGEELPPVAESQTPSSRLRPSQIVPEERYAAYDVNHLLSAIFDRESVFEFGPRFGPSVVTAFARLDGMPVAVIATNPAVGAGALEPNGCDKASRLLCMADAFNLPVVLLHDSPGFFVGQAYEAKRIQAKTVTFLQALMQFTGPKLSVVVRKSFGLAFTSLGGTGTHSDYLAAWPAAEIGFMDPQVAANAMHGDELDALDAAARRTRRGELATLYARDTDPYAIARGMNIDEIIHPDDTRVSLVRALRRFNLRRQPANSPLRYWPTRW